MSNRRRSRLEVLRKLARPKCPKCKSTERTSVDYPDGYTVHICKKCRFPLRQKT